METVTHRTVLPVTLLCLLSVSAGGKEREREPMPVFSGTLKRLDERSLVLELDDFRTLEFRRTAKTRFFEKKKPLDPMRLKPADAVSVEATQDIDGSLTAVNVYLEHAAQPEPREEDRGGKARNMVIVKVVCENGREDYRDVQVNGKPVKRGMQDLAGAWSTGEFGSVPHDLFSPRRA